MSKAVQSCMECHMTDKARQCMQCIIGATECKLNVACIPLLRFASLNYCSEADSDCMYGRWSLSGDWQTAGMIPVSTLCY